MNKLNNVWPSIEHWGPPLVAGLQLDPVSLIMALWDLPVFNPSHCPLIQHLLSLFMRILWYGFSLTCLFIYMTYFYMVVQRCIFYDTDGNSLINNGVVEMVWWSGDYCVCGGNHWENVLSDGGVCSVLDVHWRTTCSCYLQYRLVCLAEEYLAG